MIAEIHQQVFEEMQDLHTDLRECVCECGCGEHFFQKRVGRVRKYSDKSHKAKAARDRKSANKAEKPLVGTIVKELLDLVSEEYYPANGIAMLTPNQNAIVEVMRTTLSPAIWETCLNELHERYAAH